MPYQTKFKADDLISSFQIHTEDFDQKELMMKSVKRFFEHEKNDGGVLMNLFLDYSDMLYKTEKIYKRTVYWYAILGLKQELWRQFTEVCGYQEYYKQRFFITMNRLGLRYAQAKTICSVWGAVKGY